MSRPSTLLEGLCGHARSLGAESIEVETDEGRLWVFASLNGTGISIASYPSSGRDARELRGDLYKVAKKGVRTLLNGEAVILKVRTRENFGDDVFDVTFQRAQADPSAPPKFTGKQGQYLAFIYYYTKIHRQPPAESDLEQYFRVSPPSVHEMLKTLQRNGLIERTPHQARSIRLLVAPDHLPRLEE
jgi:repressor LexA